MTESIPEKRTASELQDRVTELIEQQTAISEVLLASSRRHDLQPIFDAILDSATRPLSSRRRQLASLRRRRPFVA